jgi:Tol biopolymer transport system component
MKIFFTALLSFCFLILTQVIIGQTTLSSVTLFRDSAMCSAWSQQDPTLLAYSLQQPDGHYEICLANVSPTNQRLNERCITCGNSLLPGKTVGNPAFDPKGKYIAFVAEKAVHPGGSFNSTPGIGQYSDVWVMTMDKTKAFQLTNTPNSVDSTCGVMFLFFSPDGKKIMWTQMTKPVNGGDCLLPFGKLCFGGWVVKIADFVDDAITGPSLKNIRTIQPGGVDAFNEAYGWTPDGKKILFASDYNQPWVWADQIYSMDTLGNNIQQLSATGGATGWPYCEHAFSSPDGKEIVWITNLDQKTGSSKGGDDWFIMNSDGTNQRRLAFFNDSTSSYWTGDVHVNGFGSFCPDGKRFAGDVGGNAPVQQDPTQIYHVYIMNLNTATGIQSNEKLNTGKIHVFPNPASDLLNVSIPDNSNKIYYSIYNLIGSKLSEGVIIGGSSQIDVSTYPVGMYFLKLSDGRSEITKKFLVGKN